MESWNYCSFNMIPINQILREVYIFTCTIEYNVLRTTMSAEDIFIKQFCHIKWVDCINCAPFPQPLKSSRAKTAYPLPSGAQGTYINTWIAADWGGINSQEDLILARMHQLDARQHTEELAVENLHRSRLSNKEYFDQHKRLRPESQQLSVGDLVLFSLWWPNWKSQGQDQLN